MLAMISNVEVIDREFQARHILTPMTRVLCVEPRRLESVVCKELTDGEFDAAPVREDGQVTGLVERNDLMPLEDAPVAAKVKPLTSSQLISAETSLSSVLTDFGSSPFLFVVDDHGIGGIVAPADFNKQAGRAYFYLLVSTLEVLLAERLRERDDHWLDILKPSRRDEIIQRLDDLRRQDVLADMVSAFNLIDLLSAARHLPEFSDLGSRSNTVWNGTVVAPINNLRNCVMHSVRALTSNSAEGLRQLQSNDALLRDLIGRASAHR
jgi:hypothetical protein